MDALTDFPRQLLMPAMGESWEGDSTRQLGGGLSAEGSAMGHDRPSGAGGRMSPPSCTDMAKCSVRGIRVVKPARGLFSWPGSW